MFKFLEKLPDFASDILETLAVGLMLLFLWVIFTLLKWALIKPRNYVKEAKNKRIITKQTGKNKKIEIKEMHELAMVELRERGISKTIFDDIQYSALKNIDWKEEVTKYLAEEMSKKEEPETIKEIEEQEENG